MHWVYYEKVSGKQRRWYYLAPEEGLFGPILIRQWGRLGHYGGRRRVDAFDDEAQRLKAWKRICATRRRHGYSVVRAGVPL